MSERVWTRRVFFLSAATLALACSTARQSAGETRAEDGLPRCPAATTSAWKWKPAAFGSVRLEVPDPFIERLEVDSRSRLWEYGPRMIRLTLTTERHTERTVPFFGGRCELELGDRSVEVVRSTNSNNDRLLTARVPNVDGGFDLLIVVLSRYPQEIDALRRVITSRSGRLTFTSIRRNRPSSVGFRWSARR